MLIGLRLALIFFLILGVNYSNKNWRVETYFYYDFYLISELTKEDDFWFGIYLYIYKCDFAFVTKQKNRSYIT